MKQYTCKTCKKRFSGKTTSHIYKFCSRRCFVNSPACCIGNGKNPRKKDKIFRNGYYYIHKPDHPFCHKQGYVAEHRLVMEKKLGRYLTKEEAVHHINHIITDNRIENLELFSSHGQHSAKAHPEVLEKMRIASIGRTPHNKGKRIKHTLICKYCHNPFEVFSVQKRKMYCSKECVRRDCNTMFKKGLTPWNKGRRKNNS